MNLGGAVCARTVGLMCVLMLAACAENTPSAKGEALALSNAGPQVRALHAHCVEAMVRSACVAAKDAASASAPPSSPVVFLAGVGAVDARFYGKLRAAGDSMCEVLVQPCNKSWDGSECKTARALWSAP